MAMGLLEILIIGAILLVTLAVIVGVAYLFKAIINKDK